MQCEKTLIILKPDAIKRNLVGKIIGKIEEKNYTIESMNMKTLSVEDLTYHYDEHKGKGFFPDLLDYMSSGPVVIMVVSGDNVIKGMRKLCGATDPLEADAGTIRGTYASTKNENLIHSSDSIESSKREVAYFIK
ncbi:nucleoside-diphosphate kinase [Alkalibaculum sporogenes]|uniref:nucleoside-diphosphate kinase n=1 Tax=Alkalibaculum sporogenes TaxID=2655001 RepID=UPI0031B5DFE7